MSPEEPVKVPITLTHVSLHFPGPQSMSFSILTHNKLIQEGVLQVSDTPTLPGTQCGYCFLASFAGFSPGRRNSQNSGGGLGPRDKEGLVG